MDNKPHEWNTHDKLTSIKDITLIGLVALKEIVGDVAQWADRKVADRLNGSDDDS